MSITPLPQQSNGAVAHGPRFFFLSLRVRIALSGLERTLRKA